MDGIWQGGRFVLQSTIEERVAKLEAQRDALLSALDDIVTAWELPGAHCEMVDAMQAASKLLEAQR